MKAPANAVFAEPSALTYRVDGGQCLRCPGCARDLDWDIDHEGRLWHLPCPHCKPAEVQAPAPMTIDELRFKIMCEIIHYMAAKPRFLIPDDAAALCQRITVLVSEGMR